MKNHLIRALAAGTAAWLAATPCLADDVDDLTAKAKPPARFKDYKPNWSIKEQDFTFQDFDGPVTVAFYLVMDGDRCVAYIPRGLFQSGRIFVQDFRPGQAPTKAILPAERLHIETETGTHIRSDAFIPNEAGNRKDTYDFKVAGDRLVLTRKYEGRTKFNKWSHRSGGAVRVKTTNTFVLRVDPVLGYVVECSWDTWTDQNLTRFEYASAASAGRHSTWPDEISCYRMAISTGGKEGFHGYATNMGATGQHGGDGVCRNNGIVAFLNDKTGWSPTYVNATGTAARLVVCGPHTDHDFTLDMTKIAKENRDGMTHYIVRHRMLAMPPELTRYVWDNMNLLHKGQTRLLLRMGALEDFEEQPLPLDGRQRGHVIGGEVSTEAAHSGRKSLKFTGTVGIGSPTLCVKPNTRYRLQGWMKAVPANPEAKGAAEAFITCQYQEWPGGRKQGQPMKSAVVKAGDDWKHLVIEFTAPAWGPALNLSFIADNCTAYLDDFRLAPVKGGD